EELESRHRASDAAGKFSDNQKRQDAAGCHVAVDPEPGVAGVLGVIAGLAARTLFEVRICRGSWHQHSLLTHADAALVWLLYCSAAIPHKRGNARSSEQFPNRLPVLDEAQLAPLRVRARYLRPVDTQVVVHRGGH